MAISSRLSYSGLAIGSVNADALQADSMATRNVFRCVLFTCDWLGQAHNSYPMLTTSWISSESHRKFRMKSYTLL